MLEISFPSCKLFKHASLFSLFLSTLSCFLFASHVAVAIAMAPWLDIIIRPQRRHLGFEGFKRELERRARVSDLELFEHTRVQYAQLSDLYVLPVSVSFRSGPRTVVNCCGATGKECRVCPQ
jgi:hypothetical protein